MQNEQPKESDKYLTAMNRLAEAIESQTRAINDLVQSNAEVVDLLIGATAPDDNIGSEPQYLGRKK